MYDYETDDDYEEPPWQGAKVEPPDISNNDLLANMKRHAEQAGNQKCDLVIQNSEEVINALAELEPVWTSKGAPASEVLKKTLRTVGFLNGNDLVVPEPDNCREVCNRLGNIERVMHEMLTYNSIFDESTEEVRILQRRCRDVMYSVRFARQGLVCLCASIAYSGQIDDYDLTHSSVEPLIRSPLRAPRALAMQQEPPPHLNEDLLSEAIAIFNSFVDSVGNKTNGKSNRWELKAQAVHNLEEYVREKLAVKAGSFFFFDKETGKLTDSQIWWRKDSAVSFEILSWTRLLQDAGTGYAGNLNVIPSKTHQQFLDLLKRLAKRKLY